MFILSSLKLNVVINLGEYINAVVSRIVIGTLYLKQFLQKFKYFSWRQQGLDPSPLVSNRQHFETPRLLTSYVNAPLQDSTRSWVLLRPLKIHWEMQNSWLKMPSHISKGVVLAAELHFYNAQNVISDLLLRLQTTYTICWGLQIRIFICTLYSPCLE